MSKSRCRELAEIGDREFTNRMSLLSHWQDIAEHFLPARADFTTIHSWGEEFASHLMTGYPAMQARELADQLATMLRPRQKLWAKLAPSDERLNDDPAARMWLEQKSEVMRRAMYAEGTNFLRATKAGDKDFVAFGQCVIQVRMNRNRDGLLYINRHLRDTVWCENADMQLDAVHRKEKMTAKTLCQYFPKTVHESVKRIKDKEPYKEINCRHIVIPSDDYQGGDKKINVSRFPYLSIYIDQDNDVILEEVPQTNLGYVVPRWDLGAVGQYAVSPATMLGLPDARLLQTMYAALLEAAEKGVNPPILARGESLRSDIQVYANGVTYLDIPPEGSVGDHMQAINPEISGMQFGLQMLVDVQEKLKQIFYLNKLNLPEFGKDMTAFEVQQRIAEYVRSALPLFEPMETEYNGALCKETAHILVMNGAFSVGMPMPESLAGADLRFEFESPLQATADRSKVMSFQEAAGLIATAAQVDPGALNVLDIRKALLDALDGVEVPEDWKRDPQQVAEMDQQALQMQQAQQAMGVLAGGSEIAKSSAAATKDFAAAESAMAGAA